MNFFGRRKESPPLKPKPADPAAGAGSGGGGVGGAVGNMKETIANMTKRQQLLEKKMTAEKKKALQFKNKGNKKSALLCLKKSKMHEKEVDRIVASVFNLEQQVATLESSQTTADIVNTQKEFKNAMKKIQGQINVDDVAELQDDIAEQMQVQDEVSELLGQSALDDEDELEDELNELMLEEDEQVVDVAGVTTDTFAANTISSSVVDTSLPSVPSGAVETKPVAEDEDDIALRELQAEMAS